MKLERIHGYEVHPAASRFPLMSDEELDELAADIKARGLDNPVVLLEGKVLDGRNRLEACHRAGVPPKTVEWRMEKGSAVAYVLAANVLRRHLTQSQRAAIAAELLPDFETEAKERQRRAGGDKKSGSVSAPVREAVRGTTENHKAAAAAAAAAGVSTRYVESAKAVGEYSPELLKKVKEGELTLKQAEKSIRKAQQVEKVKVYRPPEGRYSVIAADPPWPFDDQLDGSDEARGGLPYPAMTVDQIAELKIPADDDCVLWLWCTNTHLADGSVARVLKGWGFTPKSILTWDKCRMGAGRWLRGITEHCVIAVKGKPTVTLTNQTTLISEPRREHSRKPEAFYRLVEELCPATTRLEMFARGPRDGWVTTGAEEDLFPPAKKQPELLPTCRGFPLNSCDLRVSSSGEGLCAKCARAEQHALAVAQQERGKKRRRIEVIDVPPGEEEKHGLAPRKCIGHDHMPPGATCDSAPNKTTPRCPSCTTRQAYIEKAKREGVSEVVAASEFKRTAKSLGFKVERSMLGFLAKCGCGESIGIIVTKHGDVPLYHFEQIRKHHESAHTGILGQPAGTKPCAGFRRADGSLGGGGAAASCLKVVSPGGTGQCRTCALQQSRENKRAGKDLWLDVA